MEELNDEIIYIPDKDENEKVADNSFHESSKNEIEEINDKISYEENGIKLLEKAREDIININKQFEKCTQVYSDSVKGVETNQYINNLLFDNEVELKKINIRLDEKKRELNINIKLLNSKKEQLESTSHGGEVYEG